MILAPIDRFEIYSPHIPKFLWQQHSHTSTKSYYPTSSVYFAILSIYLKQLLLRTNNVYVQNLFILSIQIEPDVIEHYLYWGQTCIQPLFNRLYVVCRLYQCPLHSFSTPVFFLNVGMSGSNLSSTGDDVMVTFNSSKSEIRSGFQTINCIVCDNIASIVYVEILI